ncbi:glycosyltransferase family 4 protein [Halioxenophilus sp. WMMB6]|uniref:glycosyltransferase family 4 protein n=1 Tax=Halioxenophilus sp. WMMB6 TaxID=3073815 RepID=UPI00295E8929|nr:glycosyltransferase family 4 protein [Halioxenophilus sp. WMMB6]
MKIGYLSNIYPVTSGTFIRREIHALERQGVTIKRFAFRTWTEELVDPADIAEREVTHYLLSGNSKNLLKNGLKTLLGRPKYFWRALKIARELNRNAKGPLVHHIAYFLEACSLFVETEKEAIDHVHAHYSTNTAAVAMLCRELGGPTFSFTVHGPDEFDAPYHSSMPLKVAKAAFVVAITDFCKSQIVRYSSYDHWHKIKVFRCGIATDEFTPSNHTFDDNYQLVCVARMSGLKGQMLFPEAIAPLTEKYPKLKIVLVGDGDIRPLLEAKIKELQLENFFDLCGWQSNKEVHRIVGESRALILASFAEGLPIVFMEAFALGRPAVATYIAGIPELIDEECGWVVPAGSIQRLTEALDKVLAASPAELEAKGAEGRRRVEQQHDINGLASNLKAAFSEQIERNNS